MARTAFGMPGIYNASNITLLDGEGCALAVDVAGITKFNNAYLHAGESLSEDLQRVLQYCSYVNITADTAVKSVSGYLCGFVCNSTTSGTVKYWDNTAGSGNVLINTFTPTAGNTYVFGSCPRFSTALYADITNTLDITVFFI